MLMERTADELKQIGMEFVESHNKRWVERMRAQAKKHARLHGQVCSDDLRRYADSQKDYPIHPNAWGAVMRCQGFVVVKHQASTYPSTHGREIRVWRLLE